MCLLYHNEKQDYNHFYIFINILNTFPILNVLLNLQNYLYFSEINIIIKLALTSSPNKENYLSIRYFILSCTLVSVAFNIRQITLI